MLISLDLLHQYTLFLATFVILRRNEVERWL